MFMNESAAILMKLINIHSLSKTWINFKVIEHDL